MISKLSHLVSKALIQVNSINEEDTELYTYGAFILISNIIYLVFTLLIGLLAGCVLESVIYHVAFQFIRRFAGGYHASSEARCEIMSTISIIVCILVIKLSKIYDLQTLLIIASTISVVCIFILCPLDTPEKPLTDTEYKYFRKISWLILSLIFVVVVVTYFAKFNILFAPCCMSLILEAILLIAGKIKKVYQTKNASE